MAKVDHDHGNIQRILDDDRPIALRKRPRGVANKTEPVVPATQDNQPRQQPKTPTKAKKKVRFSDPGPEINSTTGLTPHLEGMAFRNSIGPIEGIGLTWPSTPSSRRSMVSIVDMVRGPESPVKVQFFSLRQVLTPRSKRQIARKDLSDEMNTIGDEKKLITKQQAELQELRRLINLPQTESPADRTYIEDSHLDRPDLRMDIVDLPELDKELSSIADSHDGDCDTSISSSEYESHESTGIFFDQDGDQEDDDQSKLTHSLFGRCQSSAAIDQIGQTRLSTTELEDHIAIQTAHFIKARLELEHIFPGETSLPLNPSANGDCSPLLNAMLGHLQNAALSTGAMKKAAANAETQRLNMQSNFNQALAKIEYAQRHYNILRDGAREGEAANIRARRRISSLEKEVERGNKSSESLRRALDKYRIEVHALEDLITRLEAEGKDRVEKIMGEMNERIFDLKNTLLQETKDRFDAEQELESSGLQIQMFQSSEKELKESLSEKQAIVRDLEKELYSVKSDTEQQLGCLNVKIGRLEQELGSARLDIDNLEKKTNELHDQLDKKRSTDIRTIGQLRDELRKAVRGVEDIVEDWEVEIAHEKCTSRTLGLITPSIEGGRFRDVAMDTVDGAVEVARGRSRKSRNIDSAIGISDEDMEDV